MSGALVLDSSLLSDNTQHNTTQDECSTIHLHDISLVIVLFLGNYAIKRFPIMHLCCALNMN